MNSKDSNDEEKFPHNNNFKSIVVGNPEKALFEAIHGENWNKYYRVAMAALGSLSWIGAILSAGATLSAENEQGDINKLNFLWMKEHEEKLKDVIRILNEVFEKFKIFGDRIEKRINSEEYMSLVRGTFQRWDKAETLEKKEMFRKLITNAGGTTIVQDDWVRMFSEWIEQYNELHFRVIFEIHKRPGITRHDIWMNIKGKIPTDSSDEADMFKLLIDDLTRGRVIRQHRETNSEGRFYKKTPQPKGGNVSPFMESPFDSKDPYDLTELGSGFVQYVKNELTPQIEDKK